MTECKPISALSSVILDDGDEIERLGKATFPDRGLLATSLAFGAHALQYEIGIPNRVQIGIAIGAQCTQCGQPLEVKGLIQGQFDLAVSPCKNCCKEAPC